MYQASCDSDANICSSGETERAVQIRIRQSLSEGVPLFQSAEDEQTCEDVHKRIIEHLKLMRE